MHVCVFVCACPCVYDKCMYTGVHVSCDFDMCVYGGVRVLVCTSAHTFMCLCLYVYTHVEDFS